MLCLCMLFVSLSYVNLVRLNFRGPNVKKENDLVKRAIHEVGFLYALLKYFPIKINRLYCRIFSYLTIDFDYLFEYSNPFDNSWAGTD